MGMAATGAAQVWGRGVGMSWSCCWDPGGGQRAAKATPPKPPTAGVIPPALSPRRAPAPRSPP